MYDAATDTQNVCVIMYKRIVGPRRTFYHLRGSLELGDRELVRWAIYWVPRSEGQPSCKIATQLWQCIVKIRLIRLGVCVK